MLNVVGQLTATTLNVGRNDVADRAIGKSHNKSSLENYQSRSLMLSNCSASNDRRSCALVFVTVPGVEPLTLTAAALARFAAVLAAALFVASAWACRPLWTASKSSGFKRIALSYASSRSVAMPLCRSWIMAGRASSKCSAFWLKLLISPSKA